MANCKQQGNKLPSLRQTPCSCSRCRNRLDKDPKTIKKHLTKYGAFDHTRVEALQLPEKGQRLCYCSLHPYGLSVSRTTWRTHFKRDQERALLPVIAPSVETHAKDDTESQSDDSMSNCVDSSNDNDIEINNSNDTSFDIPTVSERVKATSFQDLLAKATAERLQQTNRIVDQSITQTTTALEEWRARNAAKQDQKDIDSESEADS